MILSKEIEIKISHNNLRKYNELGYECKVGDTIFISIEHLSSGSKVLVLSKCDYCYSKKEISYCLYNRSISKGNKFSCSHKCADIKRREILKEIHGVDNLSYLKEIVDKRKITNLEKYGVESLFQLSEFKEKIKLSLIEKYGVDNYTKTPDYLEKSKKTNLEKYGTEWYLQSEDKKVKSKKSNIDKYGVEFPQKLDLIKDKTSKTNIDRYGAKSPMMSDEIKEKSKKTLLKNYGVDNPMKSEKIKELSRTTNLDKYGYEYPIKSSEIKERRGKNNIDKWGVTNASLSEKVRKNMIIGRHPDYRKYISDGVSLFKCYKNHDFDIKSENFYKRVKQNIPLCTVCNPIGDSVSIKEKEVFEFVKSIYFKEIIQSYRDGLEIDIYLPDLHLGFEFNGLYWHSEENKTKNYHLDKTNYFKERGIRIIHIWEDDWDNRKEIIKSQIKNWIGLNNRKIGARECIVAEITDSKISKIFLNNNHIQGYVNSIIKLGLYHNDELVSIMTFDRNEGRKKMGPGEWNLSRFCNLLDTNVIGGASKLLKYFMDHYHCIRMISYADKDWSTGDVYNILGFDNIGESDPDYKYIIDNKRVHKSRFKKSKLNTDLSESKHMREMGYNRIFDCGKIKYEKIIIEDGKRS